MPYELLRISSGVSYRSMLYRSRPTTRCWPSTSPYKKVLGSSDPGLGAARRAGRGRRFRPTRVGANRDRRRTIHRLAGRASQQVLQLARAATGGSMSTTVEFLRISGWRRGRSKRSSPFIRIIPWKAFGPARMPLASSRCGPRHFFSSTYRTGSIPAQVERDQKTALAPRPDSCMRRSLFYLCRTLLCDSVHVATRLRVKGHFRRKLSASDGDNAAAGDPPG
jgi:hypothetical protein